MYSRLALVLVAAISLSAQSTTPVTQAADVAPNPQTPGPPPIQVQVNEVIVPVTVTDEKGRFVSDLDQKDFTIYDEDKEQQIQFFTRERNQPVVVGFLIDLSNSSRLHWKNYQDAAVEMVQNLIPGDNPKFSGYLIGYSNTADLLKDTSTDPEPMVEKIGKLKPSGGSALYDAIYMACTSRRLVQGEPIEPAAHPGDRRRRSRQREQKDAAGSARDRATQPGHDLRREHDGYGFDNEDAKNLTAGRGDRRTRGISLARNLQGRGRFSGDPLRRRQLRAQGGDWAIRGRDRQRHVPLGGRRGGRSDHPVHPPLYPELRRRQETVPQYRSKVNLGNVKVRARKGYYPFAPQ